MFYAPPPFDMGSCEVPTNVSQIRLAVLTFIGYKRTSKGKGEGGGEFTAEFNQFLTVSINRYCTN